MTEMVAECHFLLSVFSDFGRSARAACFPASVYEAICLATDQRLELFDHAAARRRRPFPTDSAGDSGKQPGVGLETAEGVRVKVKPDLQTSVFHLLLFCVQLGSYRIAG